MTVTQAEHIKKLEWAVRLSQLDLQTLREGDWINLERKLADFVGESGTPTDLTGPGWLDPEPVKRVIIGVQKVLREHFEKLASMGTVHVMRVGGSIPKKLSAISFLVSGRLMVKAFEGETYRQLVKASKIEWQVSSALASYLISSGIVAGQIRKCCGRIFLYKRKPRGDKELHCNLKCSRLAATRRYREKKANELKPKERERSHRRYVDKQLRTVGPNVKVARKPRKATPTLAGKE